MATSLLVAHSQKERPVPPTGPFYFLAAPPYFSEVAIRVAHSYMSIRQSALEPSRRSDPTQGIRRMSSATNGTGSLAASAINRDQNDNPLLKTWTTPFGLPPFSEIEPRHFAPAFEAAMHAHAEDVRTIAENPEAPTFANTIAAMDRSFLPLERVADVFFNQVSTCATPDLQAIERDIAPALAAHSSTIFLNSKLYERIKALYDARAELDLTPEEARVLDRYNTWFIRAGAALGSKERERVAQIDRRLAELATQFNQNVLADEQSWHLPLMSDEDLAGLPPMARANARRAAKDLGLAGDNAHAITLGRSSVEGFLTFSDRRDLREAAFRAWIDRGAGGGATDNSETLAEIVRLRTEIARLKGYPSFADYVLADTMAKSPEAVRGLLDRVWPAAKKRAMEERDALAERARSEGGNFAIQPWDWRYYAERERKVRYDLDEGELRAYLKLDNVIAAAFDTAGRLFGLKFTELPDAPRFHPDVRVFEVTDKDGLHVAIFMADYFARSGKRSGAWMTDLRASHKLDGEPVRPIIVNVMNFSRGSDDEPTLISMDDARTLFHEFGHGLHGMLSDVTYPSVAGTKVARDFVELPSQLYEHWFGEPEVLGRFALHYQTGEPMPQSLIDKLKAAQQFNQGFATVEYTACALLDLEMHALEEQGLFQPAEFERDALDRIGMPGEIVMRHRLPHFTHITGGYAAGYYSYLWSEVMDADAFAAFKETGDIYNPDVAARLKSAIYAAGNSQDPHQAYIDFRGRPPEIDGLLEKRGLVNTESVG